MATAKKAAPKKKTAAVEQTNVRFKILPVSKLGDGPHTKALKIAVKKFESTKEFAEALGMHGQSLNRCWQDGRVPDRALIALARVAEVLPYDLDRELFPSKDWVLPVKAARKTKAKAEAAPADAEV